MIRLPATDYTYSDTIDKCVEGILRKPNLRRRLIDGKEDLLAFGRHYEDEVGRGTLYRIEPIGDIDDDFPVVGALTAPDMLKVYENYFVAERKPARRVYEALLLLAKGQCPFCGIGNPRNLDHFLPKSQFPQFAVYPKNLVPSCRDCNMDGKAEAFAALAEEQIIHPYSDANQFFTMQWVSAAFHPGRDGIPGRVEFFVNPPDEWAAADKEKVRKHFHGFDLGRRYGTQAAQRLGGVLRQLEGAKVGESYEQACARILSPIIEDTTFVNDWYRVMHQALLRHFLPALPEIQVA